MTRYNLYYDEISYKNLTLEECAEILQDYAEKYYQGENIHPEQLKMEEIDNGN